MKREYSDERKNRSLKDNNDKNNKESSILNTDVRETSPSYSKMMKPTENSRILSQPNELDGSFSFCSKYNKSKIQLFNKKKKKETSSNIIKLENVINKNGLNKIKQYLKEKGIL